VYPTGGYKTVTPVQLANALGELARGTIAFRAFRVYLGCFELQAAREAAARSRTRTHGRRRAPHTARYRAEELLRLLPDVSLSGIKRDLRRLARAGLVVFTPDAIAITETPLEHSRPTLYELCCGRSATRPIPIPRRTIAFLCRSRKPALVKTLLAYLVRGLSIDRATGEVRGAGTAKATWIARVFGLSERAARSSRAELIRLAVISPDTGSHQRKLNRDGAYFRVNLAWGEPTGSEHAAQAKPDAPGPLSEPPSASSFAPPTAGKSARFAPPEERPGTPPDLKNQELAPRDGAGSCGMGRGPTLKDIRPEDIRRLSALRELYRQATAAGWLPRSEASFLAFAAAAVRANRASGDPVRIFVAIVRRGLWHHITQADEDRARNVINRGGEDGSRFVRELLQRLAA
jgi:hypothetical protein